VNGNILTGVVNITNASSLIQRIIVPSMTMSESENDLPFVSVIIPFYKNESWLKECVIHCEKLDYPRFEIIVVGNTDKVVTSDRVKWIKIADISQGFKKDAGIANAKGEICAFVDDDAFPHRDWIKNAVKHFEDPTVGAVCGPGVAPPVETIREKACSSIVASYMGSGLARYRYVPTHKFVVDGTAPGYNFFVLRSLIIEIDGFRTNFRSGEDDIISDKIRAVDKKIVYDPAVVVYHRRRPLFKPFLRQIYAYALHRGFFKRHFPSESKSGGSFFALPLAHMFAIIMAFTVLFVGNPFLQLLSSMFLFVDIGVYLGSSFISGLLSSKSVLLASIALFGIPLTHFIYAVGYLKGLTTIDMGENPSY
jgi:cellulose synthase/poly-beta-1,6-N-acetylglucosamine synthase-like glycosyltransferase